MKYFSKKALRLFVLTAAMVCAMAIGANAADVGIITGDVVNARKGPGTSYERVELLAAGKQVTVLGEENGWYHIKWNNSEGYVLGEYLALSGSAAAAQASQSAANATVTGGTAINVRTGPGTNYNRVTTVGEGKRVSVLNKDGDWYRVSFDGKTGYIFGEYLISDGGTVTGGTINVRTGPGTSYGRVTALGEGKRVTILGLENGWYHISFDGKTGYILGEYLALDAGSPSTEGASTPAPATEPEPLAAVEVQSVATTSSDARPAETETQDPVDGNPGVITGGTINVRTGPGTEYDRITRVSTGKRVTILGEENGWYRISFDGKTGYVLGDYLVEGDTLPASSVGEQIAAMAQQYLGTRYVYGGSSPSGFDCSGFTLYLYRQFGYSLPHTASGQYANCGYKVSRSELLPGDLVFCTSPGYGGRIEHVAVYIGNGQIVHARYSVGQVYTNSLSESYYSNNYVGAIRIA